jgi:hypothetical protein
LEELEADYKFDSFSSLEVKEAPSEASPVPVSEKSDEES